MNQKFENLNYSSGWKQLMKLLKVNPETHVMVVSEQGEFLGTLLGNKAYANLLQNNQAEVSPSAGQVQSSQENIEVTTTPLQPIYEKKDIRDNSIHLDDLQTNSSIDSSPILITETAIPSIKATLSKRTYSAKNSNELGNKTSNNTEESVPTYHIDEAVAAQYRIPPGTMLRIPATLEVTADQFNYPNLNFAATKPTQASTDQTPVAEPVQNLSIVSHSPEFDDEALETAFDRI